MERVRSIWAAAVLVFLSCIGGGFAASTADSEGGVSVAGRVQSRNWPFGGVSGVTVAADSGQSTLTIQDGTYILTNVPPGLRRIAASRIDYEASSGSDSAWQDIELAGDTNGINFTEFSCKSLPQVSIAVETNIVAPGQALHVTVTLKNTGPDLLNVDAQVALSFNSDLVMFGSLAEENSATVLSTDSPPPDMPGVDLLVSAWIPNGPWTNGQSYSLNLPLTVNPSVSNGTITFKYRGQIGDKLDPADPSSGVLDQQGWPVWTTNVIIQVPQPFQLLAQSISTNTTRDGQTFTLGYEIYSPIETTGWLGCRLEKRQATPPEVVEDPTHEPPQAAPMAIAAGTNWYYRDFFVNLGPQITPGVYDVTWSAQFANTGQVWTTESEALTVLPPVSVSVPILMYHKVGPESYSYFWVATSNFLAQMRALKAYGYTAITLQELMDARAGLSTLPPKPVVLTFDDGNASLLTDVHPILSDPAINFKATSFIITGKVGQDSSWDGDCCYVSRQLTWDEIRGLHEGGLIDFQSHGLNHPYYLYISDSEVMADVAESKQALETQLQKTVRFLAYPFGFYTAAAEGAVHAAGYFAALTAWGGMDLNCTNKYVLKRVGITTDMTVSYDPDWSPSFFFSFDDTFQVPEIDIDSIEYLDAVSDAPLADGQAVPGQAVKLRFTAINSGQAVDVVASLKIDLTGDHASGVLYDSHQVIPTEDLARSFPPGQQIFEWLWTAPTNAPAGPYSIRFEFHDQYYVLSFMYADWLPAFEVLPPLSVTNMQIALTPELSGGSVLQGETVSGQGSVSGAGRGLIEYAWMVRQPDGTDWSSGPLSLTLSNGSAIIPSFDQFPTSLAGEYNAWVRLLSPGEPTDTLCNQQRYQVLEKNPDLRAVAVSLTGLFAPGVALDASYQIGNIGTADAGNFNCKVVLSSDAVIDNQDTALASFTISGLLTNESVSGRVAVTLPTWIQPYTNYYLGLLADDAGLPPNTGPGDVVELSGHEVDNNTVSQAVIWQPPPAPVFDAVKSSLQPNQWSRTNAGEVWWSVPAHVFAVDGFAVLADNSPENEPVPLVTNTNENWSARDLADTERLFLHVRAHDAIGQWSATAHFGPFRIDATPPSLPNLISPVGETNIAGARPRFDWSDASDNLSSVTYELKVEMEVETDSEIHLVECLHKFNLTTSEYTPEESEALPERRLLWAVRAADAAGNTTDWTPRVAFTPLAAAAAVDLPVPYYEQEKFEHAWGWAASASMLLKYYGYGVKPWQAAAAFDKGLGEGPNLVEIQSWLQTNYSGGANTWMVEPWEDGDALSLLKKLTHALSQGNPVLLGRTPDASWAWPPAQGSDAVIVAGYSGLNLQDYVYYHDPATALAFGQGMERSLTWQQFLELVKIKWQDQALVGLLHADATNFTPAALPVTLSVLPGSSYRGAGLQWRHLHEGSQYSAALQWDGSSPYTGGYYYVSSASHEFPGDPDGPTNGYVALAVTRSDTLNLAPFVANASSNTVYVRLEGKIVRVSDGLPVASVSSGELQPIPAYSASNRVGLEISQPLSIPEIEAGQAYSLELNLLGNTYNGGAVDSWDTNQFYFNVESWPMGSVQVMLGPLEAANAGAAWRVDGGAWQSDGATACCLTIGNHLVEYKNVSGWTAPTNEPIEIIDGQTNILMRAYSEGGNNLQVTLGPAEAIAAGAQWRVDGDVWMESGFTLAGLSSGEHWIEYKEIPGWGGPDGETILVAENQVTELARAYIQEAGALRVVILPEAARMAGAFWQVDNPGQWHGSGETLSSLAAGTHRLTFYSITGWNKPADMDVQLTNGETAELTLNYTQQVGFITVTINPPEAIAAGAQWRLDGGAWQESGLVLGGLGAGSHRLEWQSLAGWRRPASQSARILEGQTSVVPVAYVQKLPPSLAVQPQAQTNFEGTTLTFSVVAAGTEPLFYQWRKDEMDIPEGERISGANTNELALANIEIGDAGGYSVVVSNVYGWVTSQVALLTVELLAPVITEQPQGQRARYHQSLTLSVSASGTSLSYQWRKNGEAISDTERISGAQSNVLQISSVQLSDAGAYSVVAGNSGGTVSSEAANVTVYGYVQAQIDGALPGETVLIPAGAFNENLVIEKNLTLQGAGSANTFLDGQGAGRVITISSQGAVWIKDLTICNGRDSAGGGIWNGGEATLGAVVITNNAAFANGGGALYNEGAAVIEDSMLIGNQAEAGPGGGINNAGWLQVNRSTLAGNMALAGAGGIFNAGTAFLTNGTLSVNVSQTGAGGVMNLGSFSFASCTICRNRSESSAGGIENGDTGAAELQNTIVSGNFSSETPSDLKGDFISQGYNLIDDTNNFTLSGGAPGDLLGQDPLLGPLADNGGPTWTHALLPGSPAIDQGSSGGLSTDQRGWHRPDNFPQLPNVEDGADIGAFEVVVDYESPGITISPANPTNTYGSNFTLRIDATGTGPLYYQWRWNGMDLADGGLVSGANADTLTISNLKSHHAGLFTVVATNYGGAATSVVQELSVYIPQPVLLNPQFSPEGEFDFNIDGMPGEKYIIEESTNFTAWVAVRVVTNTTGQIQFKQPGDETSSTHFFRLKLVAQGVTNTSEPGPAWGGGINRNYDDGYVRVDSLGNAQGQTYYWGYDTSEQSMGDFIVFHSRGLIDETTVWIMTDKYPLRGTTPPPAPYRGEFDAPGSDQMDRPRLQDAPEHRTITFY